VAIFALGFAGCGFIGFFAVSSFAPGPIAIFVGIVLGIVGGALTVYLFKPFLIVLTAILGAFDFAMGVAAILVATGVITVLTADESAGLWAFIFPFVLMIILGIVNQVLDNYRKDYVPEVPKEAEGPKEEPAAAT
jgi:ABC-type antimicrobial peptide transport system permease subunit